MIGKLIKYLPILGVPKVAKDEDGNVIGIKAPDGTLISNKRAAGLTGAQKHFSTTAFPAGTTNVTIQNQIPIPAAATGFRLVYNNGTTTASGVTTAKAAVTSTDGHTGQNLTYTSVTFDGAATATLAAISGTAPHETRSIVVSDHVSLPVAANQFLIVRTYFTGSGCADNPAAGELAAFRVATGLNYKTCFASGTVADSAVCGTVTEGQLIVPAGVIWTFDKPSYTIAAVGGSLLRGQGSSANATGLIYLTADSLTTSDRIVTPFVAAISGQGSIASMNNAKQVIEKIRPDVLVFFPGSGNDSDLSDTGFEAMKGRAAMIIDLCRRNGVVPVLGTLAPSSSLDAAGEARRVAQNAWILSRRDTVLVADTAGAVENPSNVAQILPAYDSGDGIHINNAGYAAQEAVLSPVIEMAIG